MSYKLLSTHYGRFRLLRPVHAQLRLFAFLGRTTLRQPIRRSPVFEDWVLVHIVSPLIEGGGAGLFDYVGPSPASR